MTAFAGTHPVVLCILDGWGHRPERAGNAIALAEAPNWDRMWAECPHALIHASAAEVGLPAGQMGNSEVGHMNIGAGRVVMQDLPRIDKAIEDGSLARAPALARLTARLHETGGACHLMGLMSPGGVHSHQRHIAALARLIAGAGVPVRVHAILDGRDTPPRSARDYLRQFEADVAGAGEVRIATVIGRYYAMDRDKRWDRTERAWRDLVEAEGARADSADAAVAASYDAGVDDEFVEPAAIGDYGGMADGDALVAANFRADRMRQILAALLDPSFDGFQRPRTVRFAAALGMVAYSEQLNPLIEALFPPVALSHTLGEEVAAAGLHQLRVAETEKYAHVTYFLNGGREKVFAGEDRVLVPSPKVATYDLKPEMSAFEVAERVVAAVAAGRHQLIVVNFANTDMVGHSGKLDAAIAAVEAVDACLGRLADAVAGAGGALLITADHGNAEQMVDPESGGALTAHTTNPVPVVLVGGPAGARLEDGRLADIAPTVLQLMGLDKPKAMTGHSLITGADEVAPGRAAE
jgi:2,3-bisphosphoglycerate-independent phosphoglycerate mutase